MTDAVYRIVTHADVPDLVPQLMRLSNEAFAEYEGAMPVDEAFIDWYLRRPGCRPDLCPAALHGDELVSNVLVCIQDVRLGGEVLPCGIVDTVATSPAHRGHGLARRLMEDAHRLMLDAGAEAAALYTNPEGHPYRFYQRMGYETRALGAAVMGKRPAAAQASSLVQAAGPQDAPAIRGLLDAHYAGHDGYAPMTDALWAWHRSDRPANLPVELRVLRDGAVTGFCALAQVPLLVAGDYRPVSVVYDLAWSGDPTGTLRALLASAATEDIMVFVDEASAEYALLAELGFVPAVREAALAMGFSDRAKQALLNEPAQWYVMIESVVGV